MRTLRRAREFVRISIDGAGGPAPVVNLSGDLDVGMAGTLLACVTVLADAGADVLCV